MVKRAKKTAPKADSKSWNEVIQDYHLDVVGDEEYHAYGLHVIEDRAIYGEIDGLKPVARRLLWGAHQLGLTHKSSVIKSAKIVAEAMGNYHPHGDAAIYGAMVTMVNTNCNLFHGVGNWGTMFDGAAAMRYTNATLSKYADKVFFDRFYLPVVDKTPNYDGTTSEPLILPTLLPNALLNGNFGIAPGVRTQTPTVTLDSLIPVLVQTMKDGACTAKTCMKLEMVSPYGGRVKQHPETKNDLLNFYKTGKGQVLFESLYEEVKDGIRINRFAPFATIDTLLARVEALKGVKGIRDDFGKKDKYAAYVISFVASVKGAERASLIEKIMQIFSSNVSFNMQATKRWIGDNSEEAQKKLQPTSVPDLINTWIDYRIKLEKRACAYWIKKRKEEIVYQELMRLAIKHLDFIIKALRLKITEEELAYKIAEKLKISVFQANQILDLRVRQLRALEDAKVVKKIKELKDEIASYDERVKRPKKFITKQILQFRDDFKSNVKSGSVENSNQTLEIA